MVDILQEGFPAIPSPDEHKYSFDGPEATREYMRDLVRALTSQFNFQKTDADNLASSLSPDDEAYGTSWNGAVEVPSKNAVYDKIESLGFVARTSLSYDFDLTDFTTDGSAHDTDVSAIVPAGAKAVLFGVAAQDNAADMLFSIYPKGAANLEEGSILRTQVVDVTTYVDWIMRCPTDRIFSHKASSTTWSAIYVVVKGWWI